MNHIRGFSPFQWAYGRGDWTQDLESEDNRHVLGYRHGQSTFAELLKNREKAEDCYRRARALQRLTDLRNSQARQPAREYAPGDWVYVWRRKTFAGYQKAAWHCPGRGIYTETWLRSRVEHTVPRSAEEVDRKMIVWVLVGRSVMR